MTRTPSASQARAVGSIQFYEEAKGFGFIIAADGGDEKWFFHASQWPSGLEDPEPGQRVTFEVSKDPRGGRTRANNVRPDLA